jgi:hypothetical protein
MTRHQKIACTFLLFIFTFVSVAQEKQKYLDQRQLDAVADQLIANFERLDAISIDVRDRSRSVKWDTYKNWLRTSISQARNWTDFVLAIDSFHYGITNLHSYVEVAKEIRTLSKKGRPSWPAIPLGYTYPQLSFFDTQTDKSIMSLNGRPIADIFEKFVNYYCNDLHQQGCLNRFTKYIGKGYRFAESQKQITVGYIDGSEKLFDKHSSSIASKPSSTGCEKYRNILDLKLIFQGAQSCLFRYKKDYLLKILEFDNWGNKFDDFYCSKPFEAGMCTDINSINAIINKTPAANLLIDLQNNGGGSENTPWVAALTANGFVDNLVEYKNIGEISQTSIRQAMFYGSYYAEDWFAQLKENQKENNFLPARGDFCRGSNTCLPTLIKSNPNHIKFNRLVLITNSRCVSSCDDLIWRLKAFSNAKVVGQMPSTDGAYARLMVYVILMPDGEIASIISGEGLQQDFSQGQLLFEYRVPVTRTVSLNGIRLEGNTHVLDIEFDVNKSNYLSIEEDNIKRALQLVSSK